MNNKYKLIIEGALKKHGDACPRELYCSHNFGGSHTTNPRANVLPLKWTLWILSDSEKVCKSQNPNQRLMIDLWKALVYNWASGGPIFTLVAVRKCKSGINQPGNFIIWTYSHHSEQSAQSILFPSFSVCLKIKINHHNQPN